MGAITNVFKAEKSGYATISRIWSAPPPGAPWYYWTYVSFDCNIEGKIERITIRLRRLQCKRFVKENFEGDTGYLVAKGDKLKSWKPVSAEQPLSQKSDIKVFVSYSQSWAHTAEYIVQFFRAYGLTVWLDKDRLKVGDKLNKEIIREIQTTTFFVPLLSQDYFNSEWCVKEFELAAQAPDVTILPIKVSEKRLVMPPHFERIYKDILDEPLFLDIRQKEAISNIKRLAGYMREGKSFHLKQQKKRKHETDISASKIQIQYLDIDQEDLPSLPKREVVSTDRGYYDRRVKAIVKKVEKRNKRKSSLQARAATAALIVGGIAWFVQNGNLDFETSIAPIVSSAIIAYIIAVIVQLPIYFVGKRAIKNEIKMSKLDRIALFDLRDLIEEHKKLDDGVKKEVLKIIAKELKRGV